MRLIRAHKVATSIIALAVALLGLIASLQALHFFPFELPDSGDLASKYDNTNPAEECAGEGKETTTLTASKIYSSSNEELGTAELRHSQSCNTNWIRVTTSVPDGKVVKILRRESSDSVSDAEVRTEDPPGIGAGPNYESFSEQLYAEGCFEFEVQILDPNGTVLGALDTVETCKPR